MYLELSSKTRNFVDSDVTSTAGSHVSQEHVTWWWMNRTPTDFQGKYIFKQPTFRRINWIFASPSAHFMFISVARHAAVHSWSFLTEFCPFSNTTTFETILKEHQVLIFASIPLFVQAEYQTNACKRSAHENKQGRYIFLIVVSPTPSSMYGILICST